MMQHWAAGLGVLAMMTAGTAIAGAQKAEKAGKPDLFVATDGNDAWTGKLARPNRAKTDGPLATLNRATQAARTLHSTRPGDKRGVTIEIENGTYALDAPLTLTPDDSDTAFVAARNANPIISGGVRLTNWTTDAQGRWHTTLDEVKAGRWYFSQLWVNGERRFRPRLPKSGYYTFAADSTMSPAAQGKGFDRIGFRPGDIRAAFHALSDVELLGFQVWTLARMRLQSVDEAAHTAQLTGPTIGKESYQALPKGNRYLLENVREALSGPGEFYLDRVTGELTYLPKPGETPENAIVIAPKAAQLVKFQGDPTKAEPGKLDGLVHNVTFQGLTFAHTNWNTPEQGHSFYQAEIDVNAAIEAEGARRCQLVDCAIQHTGNWGLAWGRGCQGYCELSNCELTDLGAGGVKIGETTLRDNPQEQTQDVLVRNCLIAHGGRLHPADIGVWIGHASGNIVASNDIGDLYYTGISIGWTWGYGRSGAFHNIIHHNRIEHIGQGVLSDMGGIYHLGVAPNTMLINNFIRDVNSFDYGGWGIYPDEGSTGLIIANNIVTRTKRGGFHQHYGKDNVVENNIFAFSREDGQLIRTRAEDHLSFTMRHNIVYYTQSGLLGGNWENPGAGFLLDSNLYWSSKGEPVTFKGASLAEWQAKGQDKNSRIADPLFVNVEKDDFRLKPNSPALALGFKPIDTTQIGRLPHRSDDVLTPTNPPAFPPLPAP